MADANYAEWGKFISGLTQMQQLSSSDHKLNSAEIFRGVNESLTSLYATTSGEVQSTIGKIQGTITSGFENMVKVTSSDINKTFPQITDNLSTVLSNQTRTMKRDMQRYYDALGDSLTFIPEGIKQNMPQRSTVKSGGTFLADEIFAKTNNNVSARRTAIRASLDKYKKMSLLSQDDYDRLTETLATTARGMSDEQYRSAEVDPFASLVRDLQSRLPSDKLGKTISRKVTQSQVSSYFDAEKDILGRYGNLADIISGKYIAQRIQGMGGSAKGVPIKNISSNFSKAMQTLSQYGIGMHTEQTPDGIRFGFFDAAKSGDVLSNVNGRVAADWGKMAKYTVGLPNAKGMGLKYGGMQYADQFRTYAGQDAMGPTVGVTTVSQQLLETFFNSIATQAGKTNGFINKIKNGDINLASQEIGRFLQDVIQGAYGANRVVDSKGTSTNAVYSSNPNLAKDIQGDTLAGSSIIQSVLRNSRIDLSEQLRGQYAKTFNINPKDVTGQDLQRMMDYVYAKVSSPQAADILKNIPEYQQLLTKGGGFLDQTAQLIKQIAPHVGISSIKEGNYLFGQLAGIDTGVINPFNPITSASYRGVAQGVNHVRASKTRKGKTSPFREAVMRSDLLENFGLDYSSPEQMVMNMAEINDKTIADALQGYYQDLGSSKNNDSQLQSLYKKYISKQYGGKEIGSDFIMTSKIRSDMVRALSNRILPSVYNGGMVLSEDAAKHTEGYQSRRIELSDADIKKLGISQLPDGTSPLVDFKSNNVGKRNIRLSGGREISTKDLLQSVSYQDGQYYLSYDKFVGNDEFAKMLTGAGGRFTTSTNNILTTGEFNAIANAVGLDGMGIGGFVEATKDDPRKLAAQTGESWEGLFQQAKLAGKTAKDIQSVLRSNGLIRDDNSGFFRQDKHGNLYSNFTTKSAMESSGINLEDLYNTGMKTASGADSLFYTVAKGLIGDKADAFVNNRVHASSVNKANEYTYFNPIGSTSEEYASANSHVKLTPREVEANMRSAGLLGLTSNPEISGAYRSMMNSYTGLSTSAIETANNIKGILSQAYRMSTDEGYFSNNQEAAKNAIPLNGNSALFNKKTYLPGGTLSESDYRDNTFLGNLNAQDGRRMGYYQFEQEVDLGNGRKTGGVYIPNLGGTQMANGTFMTYSKIESALQAFGKPINATVGSEEWNSIMAQRVGDYYAALQNEMGAADGTVKSILNGKKLTNAGALKAVTGQLPSNIGENTVVINDKYLKDMLRTGEGGDQAKNIANLEKLYSTMYGESGKRGNIENIIKRLKGDAKDSGDYENALINRIAQLTSVEGGSVGMQSLFHRYPFTQGLDNKNVRVRSSKNVSYGQTMVSRGLAEQINMDYDGDVGYLKNPYLSVDPDDFDAAYAEGGKLGEYNKFITSQLARMQGVDRGPNTHKYDTFKQSLDSLLGGKGSIADYVTGVLSKGNFQHVGSLSNFSEYIRDGLTSGGLDESGTKIETAAQSAIVRSLFEQLEQDAISSKKVSQRLSSLTGGDTSKVTSEMLEEAVHGQLSSVSGLMGSMNIWATKTARGDEVASTGKFINSIKEGGFIDGVSANRTSIQTIAGIEKMLQDHAISNNLGSDWYYSQMNELGLLDARLTDFDGKKSTPATITDKTGVIDFAAYEKNLANAITLNPNLYQEGISLAYARKGSYAKDGQKALDQVVRDSGGKFVSGVEAQQGQAIGSASALTNTYLERLVEVIEALAGVSGNAATSVQQVNNSFAKTAIEAARAQREMLAGTKGVQSGNTTFFPIQAKQSAGYDKNHLYDLFGQEGDGAVHQDYSFTQLASMLTGRAYTPSAKGLALGNAIKLKQNKLAEAQAMNIGEAGINSILNDVLNYESFGYDSKDAMLSDSKGLVSTQFGTLQHATMEHANKTFSSLSDIRSLFADDSDIAKRIDDIQSNGLNYSKMMGLDDLATMLEQTGLGGGVASTAQQIRSSMQALSSLGQGYKNTLGWLGVSQEGANADFANLDSVSSSIFKYLHSGNRQVIANEQALGMNVQTADGRMINIAGAFDTATYDSTLGELSLIDYKNTGRTTAENIMQQLLLKTAGDLHQGQIRDAVKTWRNGFAQETNVVDKDGNLLIDDKGKITDAGYRNMATSDDDAFGVAKGDAKALQAWNEGRISMAFAHADAEGNVRIKDIIANSGMAMDALKTWAEAGESFESLKPEQVKALTNLVSAIAREGGMFAATDGTPVRFSWMPADEDKSQEKTQQRAMRSSLASQTAYNNAELNILRAQKAWEAAQKSGNQQQIDAAQQQLEGARAQAGIASQYRSQFTMNEDGTGTLKTFNQETQQWQETNLAREQALKYQTDLSMQTAKHQQAVSKVNGNVRTMGSLIGEVLGGMKQTVQYLMRTSIVYAMIGKVKQAFSTLIQTVQSLNKSYVDLRIASGQTDSQMKDSLKVYNQMAKEMGKTTQEVANAANDWLRAGYNAEESAKLIKNSMQLSTVGMIDSAKATEYLISTMKGWKLGVDDMEGVIDKMAELDRNAAISAGDIAEAMSRANVSAQLAGSEINKYMSYITTVSDVSQMSAETVGTAFKTLYSRYGNVKAGKFVAGAGDESNSEEFEALNDIEKVLNKIGISMRDTSAEFRNFDNVLAEIAEKWATLSDVERNAISTAFAGTRQREVFNVLMQNFDKVGEFENIAENSEGSTQEKMDIYGDSVEASKNRMTAAVEEFTEDFNILGADGDDILKGWNNLLTYIIKNWKEIAAFLLTVTTLGKGLLTGSVFGGLVKLMQSLTVSAGNFATTMQTMGSNLPGVLGKLAIKAQSLGSTGAFTGKGWQQKAFDQLQETQSARVYGTVVKAGQVAGMDAIQSDRIGQFLGGMNADQAKVWNSLNAEQQQELIQQYGADDPQMEMNSAITSNTEALIDNTAALRGDKVTDTDADNVNTDNNGQQMSMFDENDNIIDTNNPSPAIINGEQLPIDGLDDLDNVANNLSDNLDDVTKSTNKLNAAQLNAAKEVGLINDKGTGYLSTIQKTDASGAAYLSQQQQVQKELDHKAKMQNLKGAASSALAMGAMMASSAIMSNTASGTGWSEGGQSVASMVASMAPMIGMMFGPWGALIGTAVSAITVGITKLVDTNVETAQEIRDAAKEAKETLNKWTKNIEETTAENVELESQEVRFKELLKGVDINTGKNISLDTSEWQEYQSILEKIIDSSDDLYKSYDAQGNIIAKSHSGFVDLNEVIAKTVEQNQKEIANNADLYVRATGERKDVLKQVMLDAEEEATPADNKDNDWGLDFDDFYLSSQQAYTSMSKGGKTINLNPAGYTGWDSVWSGTKSAIRSVSQVAGLATLFTKGDKEVIGIGANAFAGNETKDNIEQAIRAALELGYTTEEMYGLIKDMGITHGYGSTALTDDEIKTLVSNVVADIESEDIKYDKVIKAYSDQMANDMIVALQSSTLYLNFDTDTQSFLQSLVKDFKFDPYEKNSDGSYKVDSKTGERIKKDDTEIQKDARFAAQAAENLVNWTNSNSDKSKYLQNFNISNASASDWGIRELYIKEMADAVSRVDTNGDNKVDNKDAKSYDLEVKTLESNGYVIDEENLRRDKDGKIVGYISSENKSTVDEDGDGTADVDDNGVTIYKYKTSRIDKNGNAVWTTNVHDKDIIKTEAFDIAKDQREVLWNQEEFSPIKTAMAESNESLDYNSFSYSQLQLLNKYKGDEGVLELLKTEGVTANQIIAELQKLNLGENAQASEYFSLLTAEVENFSGKTEDLVDTLNDVNNSGLFSVEMLKQFADNLGMLNADGTISDEFGTAMEFLGDINISLMTTSKTLTQVQEQYQTINDAITDINDNGKISAENLEKVLDAYPNLIQYLGDTDTLMKHLNDGQATQGAKIVASLKGKITGSDDALSGYVKGNDSDKDGAFNGLVNDDDKNKFTMFGNLDAMANTTGRLYKWDKDSQQYVLEDRYQDMDPTAKDYSKNSWAKVIAENVFGIDTTKDKDTVDSQLKKAMQEAAVSSGAVKTQKDAEAMSMEELLTLYSTQLATPGYMMAQQNVLDAQAQVNAIKAAMDLEDENIKQQINDYVSNIKSQYSSGDLSSEQYIQGLNNALYKLEKQGNATKEELAEIREEIEDTKFNNLTEQFEEGAIAASKFNEELSKMAKNNVMGEEDWEKAVEAAIGANDQLKELNDKNISMLEMDSIDDFDTKRGLQQSNIDLAQKKLAEIKAAGELEYGASYNPESDPKYIAAKEELYGELKEYSEIFDEQKSFLEGELDKGYIGQQEYIDSLKAMRDSGELTAEQVEEFGEAIEDAKFSLMQTYFERGTELDSDGNIIDSNYTGAEFRQYLLGEIGNQARDSEDEKELLDAYFNSFDNGIARNEQLIELVRGDHFTYSGKDKYQTEKDINSQNAALAYEKMESLKAAGYSDDSEAVQTARAEAVKWMEANSAVDMQKASDLEEDYQNGSIGLETFVSSLEDISKSTDLTAADFEKLQEQIEDTRLELAKVKFTEGKMSGDEYRVEIMKKIQGNEAGSDDERNAIQDYVASYDTEVSISEAKAALLADNDFTGKSAYLAEDIDTLTESLSFMEAAGLQNSEQYYKNVQKIVDKKKEQLELEKQMYEYEIQKSGEVLDAYSNIISYGMDELKKRQQDINDMYDDEISKLQDINDQKQRSIELTRLEQELENSKKEKVKVYQAGVGFTYQQNKVKVKEAQQNLDQFNAEQKISDLQNAQQAQNKLIQDQIKRLQDIQDYISGIKQTAEVTASLMDLKKNGIVPQNATISDAINQITNSAVNGVDGHVVSLGSDFKTYSDAYTNNSILLAQYTDEIEGKLQAISDKYTAYSQYATDKEMVSDFATQIDTKTKTEGSPVKSASDSLAAIDNKLETFLGGKGSPTVSTINENIKGISTAITNKPVPIQSDVTNIKNNVQTIATKLTNLIGSRNFNTFASDFHKKFFSTAKGTVDPIKITSNDYTTALSNANTRLNSMLTQLSLIAGETARNKALTNSGKFTSSDGTWWRGPFQSYSNTYTGISREVDGVKFYKFQNTESKNYYYTTQYGTKGDTVDKDTQYWTRDQLIEAGFNVPEGFATGIENGPVTYTGLAMLHGSPSSPEYVLNSEQAGTLLKNLATMTISPYQAPQVDSYNNGGNSTVYQFNGDMNLPNVQRPDQFFDELLKQANVQFPTIKRNYR